MLSTLLLLATAAASGGEATPVLARTVERGEVLSRTDFGTAPVSPAIARGALSPLEAAGQEATHRLNAGAPVRAADVAPPRLVRRGENVTIALVSGALRITSPGRALADAGKGDPVRVLNLATNRTLEGVAAASGEVRISAP
ncbi:flagellar basal body P-ring formation chaperone FlgA [Novosphingobium kaempferiae]|uniref:flagellar basal body P-ring formation chaperone FlgA n=1 Tax=Novosphingobium kaempferiae TaxID=2896849 RepID=UPI001E614FBA|nr:flagellar basal body P-ring formation chaperone FlgA [Novosphingobium kaempferiae]